jgi:hypothetical protein
MRGKHGIALLAGCRRNQEMRRAAKRCPGIRQWCIVAEDKGLNPFFTQPRRLFFRAAGSRHGKAARGKALRQHQRAVAAAETEKPLSRVHAFTISFACKSAAPERGYRP